MMDHGIHQQQKLSQGLTPLLQQNLKILQATQTELNQLVNQAVESNPVLEIEYPQTPEDNISTHSTSSYDPSFFLDSLVKEETLTSHLLDQLLHSGIENPLREIIFMLIESLNERGLFDSTYEELKSIIGCSSEELNAALSILREFDPIGIAAFSLTESLLLQWKAKHINNSLTESLIKYNLHDLAKRQYDTLAKQYNVSPEEIKHCVQEIKELSLNPASGFDQAFTLISSPDIIIEPDEHGTLQALIETRSLPKLNLNPDYKEKLAESGANKELRSYLKHCFSEARLLMSAISQRQETLSKIAEYIIEYQHDFFLKGKGFLRPLKMNDLATELNVHPSTISRAVSGKFVDCPQGIFPLRYFFSSGFTDEKNEELSNQAIQNKIKKLINAESKTKPLSDENLSQILKKEGLSVARRTVAKYREQLKILPSHLRKKV